MPHHRTRPSQSTLIQPYICPRALRGLKKTNRVENIREKQMQRPHGSMPDKKRKRSDGGRMGRAKWIQRKKVIGESSCVPLEVEHRRWLGLAGGSVQEVLRGTYSGLDKGGSPAIRAAAGEKKRLRLKENVDEADRERGIDKGIKEASR
ncbi:unnamed protein product [Leuciscus chuanchicus]